jgi:hypothetical protein
MAAEQSNADEERLEEIVAYLDGELSPEESARVERRLAADESYRQQLQGIERAWKALDELPLATVDDQFSRTTMQLTVQAAANEVLEKTAALPIQRRRSRLATWLTAAAAAALGMLVVRLAWKNPERMLLADLPVIENVDVYSQIDRPDFLRMLQTELGPELDELGGQAGESPEGVARLRAVAPVDARTDWLGALTDAERTDLRAKYNRFRDLPAAERQRLRSLHQQIAEAPDADELQRAMYVYHEWLRGLPPARQFELRHMLPAEERVRTVRQWAEEMRDDQLFTLSEDELKRFVRKMRGPLIELMQAAADDLRKPPDRRPNRFPLPTNLGMQGVLAREFAAGVARPGKFQTALIAAIPERTRDAFEQLPPREKVARVMTWVRQAESLQGEVSQEELERFYAEDLDTETRAELLSLPPGEMQQTLRRLYRRQPGRGFGGPGMWGGRERGDMRRGPGGRGPDGRGPEGRGPREWDGPPPEGLGRRGPFGPPLGPPDDGGPPGEAGDFRPRRGPPPEDRPPRDEPQREGPPRDER